MQSTQSTSALHLPHRINLQTVRLCQNQVWQRVNARHQLSRWSREEGIHAVCDTSRRVDLLNTQLARQSTRETDCVFVLSAQTCSVWAAAGPYQAVQVVGVP